MTDGHASVAATETNWVPPEPGAAEPDFVAWADALPMSRALGITCMGLTPALGTFAVDDLPLPPNPNGAVHGGIVAALADHCLGIVSVVNAPRDRLSVTGSLHGQFHRPAFPPLTIRSRRIKSGRQLIFVELQVDQRDGHRCATFQATMVVGGAARRSDGI